MTEFAPPSFEARETVATAEKKHETRTLPTAEQAEPLRKGEADPQKTVHEARKAVQETAQSDAQLNTLKQLEAAENTPHMASPRTINKELKQITLRRELKNVRRKLAAPERALSALIHQPVVRAVSEGAGKTISRPSGILGGGLVALIGTSGYLYLAKHLGFEYNYFVFLALFAGGFIIGLALEFVVWFVTKSRHKTK